ncbi:alpha/beta hydrolase family protein [Petropleomorpha daqingensis]|uniref:Acetyl esterase/lipase n=1 Tax=Petropleomorpha daqingensis TaxID=2026353 RepID=A0A853C8S5_9ACTN|nr:prolyl oligopeptidase family serine peptidase [Petropleomorpha daqingensis]NYJ03727.1 acetyl esterase/lipase [Petropleomorpha daqingensis]
MPEVVAYGPDPAQFLELTLPEGEGPAPVAVVLHGGFWRAAYGVELARPLAAELAAAGWAAVAVEYRRVGNGGGWPQTCADVAAALDTLPELAPGRLDLAEVVVIGHSAGGHLAAWAAGRSRLPAGAPGAGPRVRVTAAVLQAGVLDLGLADEQGLGNGAVRGFLGTDPADVPSADPVRLLPTGAAVLCVHGAADDTVPVSQSERYAQVAAAAGDAVEVRVVPGDHMSVIDPTGAAWRIALDWVGERRTEGVKRITLEP